LFINSNQEDRDSLQGGDDSDAGAVPEPEIAVPQDKDNKGTQALEEALSGLPPRYEYLWQRNLNA
jgi:hypothetical protein